MQARIALLGIILCGGCGPTTQPSVEVAITFADVTAASGVDFLHFNGARGRFYLPETMSGGGGFFDADGDGDPDLLLVQSASWPPSADDPTLCLYRNDGAGRFTDVTAESGLAVSMYGMGMAAADYDNDGDADLLVTGLRDNRFFVNEGGGHFRDATQEVGVPGGRWSTAAAFVDLDRDGWLDLFIANYVAWDPQLERPGDCLYEDGHRDYCPVTLFPEERSWLLHNRGDGTFEDASDRLIGEGAKGLGVALLDADDDGWLDLFQANDTVPSQLFMNRGRELEDQAFHRGLAVDRWGSSFAGMGVDFTYEADGTLAVAIGNFTGEPTTFFRRTVGAHGLQYFDECSRRTRLAGPTSPFVTFGLCFLDVDRDGQEELFTVNGHVGNTHRDVPYRQRCQMFRRRGAVFEEVPARDGDPLSVPIVGRGCAQADWDLDGDVDLLVLENGGRARLLRNDTATTGRALRVRLRGTRSNRDGIGALVTVRTSTGVLRDRVVTGGSYLAQSELTLTFGLGQSEVAGVEVDWPSGVHQIVEAAATSAVLTVVEPADAPVRRVPPSTSGVNLRELSRAELQSLEPTHSRHLPWLKTMAASLIDEGRTDEARRLLDRAVQLEPGDHIAQLQRLRIATPERRPQDIAEFHAAFPDPGFLVEHVTPYLMNLNEYDLGARLLESIDESQRTIAAIERLAIFRLRSGRPEEALALLEQVALQMPDSLSVLLNRSACLRLLDRPEEAEPAARRAVELYPAFTHPQAELTRVLWQRGQLREALESAQTTVLMDPRHFGNRQLHLDLLVATGQASAVLAAAGQLVKDFPELPAAHLRRVDLLRALERDAAAVRACDLALQRFPRDFLVHLRASQLCLEVSRDREAALGKLEQARTLARTPADRDLLRDTLEVIHREAGDWTAVPAMTASEVDRR